MVPKELFNGPAKGCIFKLLVQATKFKGSRSWEENEKSTGNMMVSKERFYSAEIKPSQRDSTLMNQSGGPRC